VCRPLSGAEATTHEVFEDMADLGAPLAALVVNRLRPWPAPETPEELLDRCRGDALAADLESLSAALDPDPAESAGARPASERAAEVAAAVLDYATLCRSEQQRCDHLESVARARELGFARIAELSDPLDHLDGLLSIAAQLTTGPRPGTSC